MVPDPYRALNLPHSATESEIKRSYRELARQLHPDRLTVRNATEAEREKATEEFAKISAAYAILSDPQRKAQYDHIYKYGGYDDNDGDRDKLKMNGERRGASRSAPATSTSSSSCTSPTRKRKSTGIGYTCADPLAFLWTNGRVQSKMAVAGIQIPSRLQHTHGLRFHFSSAHLSTSPSGVTQWQSQTTQFSDGKKYTRVETTTLHADGRKEVVIENNNDEERRYVIPPSADERQHQRQQQQHQDQQQKHQPAAAQEVRQQGVNPTPWYAHAWHGLKDKLMMCYFPCTVAAAQ